MMQPMEPGDPRDPRYAYTEPRTVVDTPPDSERPVTPIRHVETDTAYAPSWRGWRAAQVVYTIGGIVEALILLRAILELLAANPNAGFSSLVYNVTEPLVSPFQGVFATPQSHGNVLDLAAVLAIIVYALLTWGVARLFELAARRRSTMAP